MSGNVIVIYLLTPLQPLDYLLSLVSIKRTVCFWPVENTFQTLFLPNSLRITKTASNIRTQHAIGQGWPISDRPRAAFFNV